MTARPIVVAAHGTVSEAGRAAVEGCAARAAADLGVPHRVGYVDVCGPELAEVLAEVGRSAEVDPVVVPLFLASGYHVRHDVPEAVAATTPGAVVTPALGVEDEVVKALVARVLEVEHQPGAVVLAGAGSSHASARAEVDEVAARLGARLGVPTRAAFLGGAGLLVPDALAALQDEGHERVVVAAHLLGPGVFLDRAAAMARAGGAAVTGALAPTPQLSALVLRRYREATARPRTGRE